MKINSIQATSIKDSRGEDTLQVVLTTIKNTATDSVPSGKSKGSFEAATKNVTDALKVINDLKEKILKKEFADPLEFDEYLLSLDGTADKSNFGGNTLLVLSLAFWRLFALEENLPLYRIIATLSGRENNHLHLPYLMFNLINGGQHIGKVTGNAHLPFQEYFIIPGTESAMVSLDQCHNVMTKLKKYADSKYPNIIQGDEGGLVVPETDPEKGLEILARIKAEIQDEVVLNLGLDIAANSFYNKEENTYEVIGNHFTAADLTNYYSQLFNRYELLSVEDPYSENDYTGFNNLNKLWGDKLWLIGDDLTTTNSERLAKAISEEAINGLILKPNQIGTISETIEVATLAQNGGLKTVVSHRSGETLDNFIADLAVGIGADAFKSGAPIQPERMSKYNRLEEIERELNA